MATDFTLAATRFILSPRAHSASRSGWSWGSTSPDIDCDGQPEIFIANGHLSGTTASDYCTEFWRHDIYAQTDTPDPELETFYQDSFAERKSEGVSWNGFEHNHLFKATQGGPFQNRAFLYGVAEEADARSALSGDFDGDGRLDLLVSVSPSQDDRRYRLILHLNRVSAGGHWLQVKLPTDMARLWGAQFILEQGSKKSARTYVAGDSYMAQHPTVLHWGLGNHSEPVHISVRWSGGQWRSGPLVVDRTHTLQIPGFTPDDVRSP